MPAFLRLFRTAAGQCPRPSLAHPSSPLLRCEQVSVPNHLVRARRRNQRSRSLHSTSLVDVVNSCGMFSSPSKHQDCWIAGGDASFYLKGAWSTGHITAFVPHDQDFEPMSLRECWVVSGFSSGTAACWQNLGGWAAKAWQKLAHAGNKESLLCRYLHIASDLRAKVLVSMLADDVGHAKFTRQDKVAILAEWPRPLASFFAASLQCPIRGSDDRSGKLSLFVNGRRVMFAPKGSPPLFSFLKRLLCLLRSFRCACLY